MINNVKTERVPLFLIFVEDGDIKTEITKDIKGIYELFGFLKCYTNKLEKELTDNIEKRDDKDGIID